jgi:hypothetical protein
MYGNNLRKTSYATEHSQVSNTIIFKPNKISLGHSKTTFITLFNIKLLPYIYSSIQHIFISIQIN